MKKVLALVLAVMMLATTAFAADPSVVVNPGSGSGSGFKNWIPGTTIKVTDRGIVDKGLNEDGTKAYKLFDSGDTSSRDASGKIVVKSINTDNYTVTNIKFNDGKKLVVNQGIKINNAEERVEIKLNQDYGKTSLSNLNVEFTLKGKKVGKSFKPENIRVRVVGTVGYNLVEKTVVINANGDVTFKDSNGTTTYIAADDVTDKAINGKVTANMKSGDKIGTYENGKDFVAGELLTPTAAFQLTDQIVWKIGKTGEDNYGDLDYTTADPDVDVTVRVYKDDKLYTYTDVDPNTDVLKAFADEDAEISFLNAPNTTFNSTATVRIYKEEGATYFYEWVDGKLVDMNGKAPAGAAGIGKKVNWDDDEGCYILKTRTLPQTLVMSDKPLPITETPIETDTSNPNPDTGANDVVGIATALAAVALVSAAAVSLKK